MIECERVCVCVCCVCVCVCVRAAMKSNEFRKLNDPGMQHFTSIVMNFRFIGERRQNLGNTNRKKYSYKITTVAYVLRRGNLWLPLALSSREPKFGGFYFQAFVAYMCRSVKR